MIVKIETYRNFDISLDTDTGEFISISDYYDTQSKKTSYNAAKKSIDDFIKSNDSFKPFFVVKCIDYSGKLCWRGGEKITISGRRKDGSFVTSEGKIISKYDENYYAIWSHQLDTVYTLAQPYTDKIKELESQIDTIFKQRKEILSDYEIKSLKDIPGDAKPN